jgi:Effector Associated Constant Component 1
MSVDLILAAEHLDEETIQTLTRELCTIINRETDLQASMDERETKIGTRGDPVTVGTILLAAVGSGGAVVALINVLKSYVDRSPELVIDVKTKSGDRIKISSKNVDAAEVKSALNTILTKG